VASSVTRVTRHRSAQHFTGARNGPRRAAYGAATVPPFHCVGTMYAMLRKLGVVVLFAAACGGGAPGTMPTGVVPAPPAAPHPVPARSAGCGVTALGPGTGIDCPRENPAFLKEVDAAIDRVVIQHPEYFDFGDTSGVGEYQVLRPAPFVLQVIHELEGVGLCAASDGKELQVKRANDFNDQYQIILSSGHIRRGSPSYRATCSPAAFPTPSAVLAPPSGCALPSSREQVCERTGEGPSFLAEVERAIDTLRVQQPQLFDGERVLDIDAYYRGVEKLLNTAGRCARYDGEEIAVKSSNDFSDQYHILLSSGLIRRGSGAFRAACYPAAF
jgi:hypothetical protein